MVKFRMDQIRAIMDNSDNIRNMSVIAHVDHGKSTLSDALICKAGIIADNVAGKARWTDGRKDEIDRGITIKSTGVSIHYKFDIRNSGKEEDLQEYLINLIDSPGHVDFSSEVTAALRVTDGALVVVDAVEGVCVQTETVLRQAMQEKIKPVLMINKIDRSLGEQMLTGEDLYNQFRKVVDKANTIVGTYEFEEMGDISFEPSKGNVAFGSGKDQWAFTLNTFARIYSKKFKVSEEQMMEKLWGENYYNPETKKWQTEETTESGKVLKRGFVQFILDPICNMCQAIRDNNREKVFELLKTLNVELSKEENLQEGKEFQKTIFSRWLPAADCLLEMMIVHLPSPAKAQAYRTSYLYEGPQDDPCAVAMRKCDPKGPLMIYISKMVPDDDNTRFYAFGRIFSGTVMAGQKVKILGHNFKPESKNDLFEKAVQRVIISMGKKFEAIGDVPCGNTIALAGIDECLHKTGTITSCDNPAPHSIRPMKYSVSPVYRVTVKPKKASELPKVVDAVKRLSKSDPLVQCTIEETGEIVIAGCGELHIEICLNDLRAFAKCDIEVGVPVVSYKETILEESSITGLVKTGNKQNRFFGNAMPLNEKLIDEIELGNINMKTDPK